MQDFPALVPPSDPFSLFAAWFAEATAQEPADPNAMVLATVGEDGFPSARAMLMKSYDSDGFVFYTNQESRKSDQIRNVNKVGLCFFWKSLYRQIHIEGLAEPVSGAESDAYFATRPRASQIGAWASQQSRPVESREAFEAIINQMEERFKDKPVPRPPHWGGYRVTPLRIEFWRGHEFRLHDRVAYTRTSVDAPWKTQRLFP